MRDTHPRHEPTRTTERRATDGGLGRATQGVSCVSWDEPLPGRAAPSLITPCALHTLTHTHVPKPHNVLCIRLTSQHAAHALPTRYPRAAHAPCCTPHALATASAATVKLREVPLYLMTSSLPNSLALR